MRDQKKRQRAEAGVEAPKNTKKDLSLDPDLIPEIAKKIKNIRKRGIDLDQSTDQDPALLKNPEVETLDLAKREEL